MTKNQRAELMKLADELEERAKNSTDHVALALQESAESLRALVMTFDDDDREEIENLLSAAKMLEEYARDIFGPPDAEGKEHFGYAAMIGTADAIREYLGVPKEAAAGGEPGKYHISPEETATAEYVFRSELYTRPIPRMEELFGNGTRDALAWLFFEALTIISTHPAYSHMTPEECYYDLLKKVAERVTKNAVTAAGGEVVVAAFPDPSKVPDIVKTGFAGVLPTGQIVDRRMYGDAIPIPGNTLLGIPGPLPVSVPACRKCRVEMVRGEALQNTAAYSDEGTGSMSGPAELVDVWKCPECGKSITAEKPENAEA